MIVVLATDGGYHLAQLVAPGVVLLEGIRLEVPTTSYVPLRKYVGAARATIARAVTWRTTPDTSRPRA